MARWKTEGVGDSSYKGKGTMRCYACGDPLRDHDIARPCPMMGVEVFHVERPPRRGPDSPEAQRQRDYRAKRAKENK